MQAKTRRPTAAPKTGGRPSADSAARAEAEAEQTEQLSASITETLESVAEFHLEHYRHASRLQRSIDWLTEQLGRPRAAICIVLLLLGWAGFIAAERNGISTPQFAWLELAGTLLALMVSVLILVTQRREDQLAERRAKLTLELALLADKKASKMIALIEELRRDHPEVADRVDRETEDLSAPADPKAVIAAIDGQGAEPPKP